MAVMSGMAPRGRRSTLTDPNDAAGVKNWWRERAGELGTALSLEARVLHREDSPYQTIEILEHDAFGRFLVLDGYIQASQADEFIYHEMAVHVPLLGREREDVSVLIIGGGDGGILREALVHDFVTSVTMVEIDQRVIDLSNHYLGVQGDYADPRVTLAVENAAGFVTEARAKGRLFDLVVLDLTEPVGPSAALFTEEFFTELVELVSPTGVILDSDSIFLSVGGGHFLQEESAGGENLVSVMRRTGLLPHIEIYRANVPFYPGADFGFFLYGRDGVSLRAPVRDYFARHYDPDIHRASFVLPRWQRSWLED
jgi:spermidine synthase